MSRLLSISIFLLLLPTAHAAVAPEEPAKPEFTSFSQRHLLLGLTEFSLYSLYLGAPDIRGSSYIPNFSPKVGLQYGYKNITVKAAFPIRQPSRENYRRGRSRETSYILSQHWRGFGFNVYYQSYQGLYAHRPLSDFSANRPDRFPQLPGAFVANAGINTYWVMSPDKYSLRAAFTQNEFQSLSGGSWLLNAYYNHLQLSTGDVFIPGTDPNSPNAPPDLSSGKFDTIGVGGGYGYAYVRGRFFAVGQAVGGLGVQYQRTKELTQENLETYAPALVLNANISAGVKTETQLGGARLLVHSISSRIVDVQVSSTLVSGQLFYGARF